MEIWKTIKGFENYQISNYGSVKSLIRVNSINTRYKSREKILKGKINKYGYKEYTLSKNGKSYYFTAHKLVALEYMNYKPNPYKICIDHINENKIDNRLENLQILSVRQNTSKSFLIKNKTSKYTGVSYYKRDNKWAARIYKNKKYIHLGYFNTEIEASYVYQNKLKEILNEDFSSQKP